LFADLKVVVEMRVLCASGWGEGNFKEEGVGFPLAFFYHVEVIVRLKAVWML